MKATIYHRSEFLGNMRKIEVSSVRHRTMKWAQYSAAVEVVFVPKGARKERGYVEDYRPSTLIVEGWGHPDPDGIWDPKKEKTSGSGSVTTSEGRYRSCDPRWQSDFDGQIDAYLERQGAKVIVDYRKHNSKQHYVP